METRSYHFAEGSVNDMINPRDRAEIIQASIWDSIVISSRANQHNVIQMFRTPIGYQDVITGQPRTYLDTSMEQSGQLPAPQHMKVQRIIFTFTNEVSDEDMYGIAENTMYRFYIGQKWYASSLIVSMMTHNNTRAPIHVCQYCKAVFVMQASCPGCGARESRLSSMGSNSGEIGRGRGFMLDLGDDVSRGLHILQGQCFRVELMFNSLKNVRDVKMWCHMEGWMSRGIQ